MRRVVWGSGCAAMVLLLSACWPVPGQNPDRTSHNPFEKNITAETVGDLEEVWRYGELAGLDLPSLVVSADGVHAAGNCRVVTVDAGTGAYKWVQTVPLYGEPSAGCDDLGGLAMTYAGEAYLITSDGRTQVVAGHGAVINFTPPPYQPMTQWASARFDAATGERLDSSGDSLIVAARGTDTASYYQSFTVEFEPGPLPVPTPVVKWTQIVRVRSGSSERSFAVATGIAPAPPWVTLGEDNVFHSGHGTLATEPEGSTVGYGVRAFPRDESRPGCIAANGTPLECALWATPTDGMPTRPVLGPGGVLYTRTPQTLYALDSATGDVLWTAAEVGSGGAPALADGLLYVPASGGRVLVFDASGCGQAECEPLWEMATGSDAEVSTPTIAGDLVYAASGGSIYAFSAAGCDAATCSTPLWSAPGGDGQPVVSFGKVYTSTGGVIIAYGLP